MAFLSKPNSTSLSAITISENEILAISQEGFLLDYKKYHHQRLALDFQWLIDNVDRSSRILEVGGFPFFLSNALINNGVSLEVIDKLSPLASFIINEKGAIVKYCDIESDPLPYVNDSFDEVVFNEVFEHLRINPIYTLREVIRVLKPGGRLWLSTPNLGSLKGFFNLLIKDEAWSVVSEGIFQQYALLEKIGWMGHVREYTSTEIVKFLEAIGFIELRVIFRGEYANPFAKLASNIYPRLLPYFTCIAIKP